MTRLGYLALFAVFFPTLAESRVAKVEVKVYDALTGQPLRNAQVSVGGDTPASKFDVSADADSQLVVDVEASAGQNYYPRSLTYFLPAFNVKTLTLKVYLAPVRANVVHNRATVAQGAAFVDKDVDRSVALLEAINSELSPAVMATQLGLYLQYNLWSAYARHCTFRFSDYCSAAVGAGNALVEHNYPLDMRADERVDLERIRAQESTFREHDLRLAYLRARWELAQGQADLADESLSAVESALANDPGVAQRLRISPTDVADIRRRIAELDTP